MPKRKGKLGSKDAVAISRILCATNAERETIHAIHNYFRRKRPLFFDSPGFFARATCVRR